MREFKEQARDKRSSLPKWKLSHITSHSDVTQDKRESAKELLLKNALILLELLSGLCLKQFFNACLST